MSRTSFDYWENNKYGNPDNHYTETKIQCKYERTRNLVRYIDRTLSGGSHSRENFRVCEFGCNNGRNLTPLYCLGYDVYGLDISVEAIDSASKKMTLPHATDSNFRVLDLYNNIHKLDDMSDNYFDFSFTMGFLMHLPRGERKTRLVNQIMRVSKNTVIYEPEGNSEKQYKDGWHESLENYEVYSNSFKKVSLLHSHPNNKTYSFWHSWKGA